MKNFQLTCETVSFDFVYNSDTWMGVHLAGRLLGYDSLKIVLRRFALMLQGRSELQDIHGQHSVLSEDGWLNCLNLSGDPFSSIYIKKAKTGLAFKVCDNGKQPVEVIKEFELGEDVLLPWIKRLESEAAAAPDFGGERDP